MKRGATLHAAATGFPSRPPASGSRSRARTWTGATLGISTVLVVLVSACTSRPLCDYDGDGLCPPEDCNDYRADIQDCAIEKVPLPDVTPTPCPVYYLDADGDGWGEDLSAVVLCEPPPDAYVVVGGDCDDRDAAVHPGAEENCDDGVDNDCNGYTDGVPSSTTSTTNKMGGAMNRETMWRITRTVLLAGALVTAGGASECPSPDEDGDGWTVADGDCDDTNPEVHPGAEEICDGIDNDCDGIVDGPQCEEVICWSNDMCQETEYCHFDDCGAKSGVCEPRPEACTAEYAPVCGCDGNTYSNACMAAAAGVSVDYEGECKPQVVACKDNEDCTKTEYCYFEEGCGPTPDGTVLDGVCTERPEVCPLLWKPVCGCDGKTYSNDCEAAAAGVNVDYEGECKAEPVTCKDNTDCGATEYCYFKEGCGDITSDGTVEEGVCKERPDVCEDVWDPVCGCDGVTYSNECFAAAAGVNVDHEGECTPTEQQECGGLLGLTCDPGYVCIYPIGTCEIMDNMGICTEIPEECPLFYDPVCGCDGKTYSNKCEATQAGVSLAYEGECRPQTTTCLTNDDCSADTYCYFEEGCGAISAEPGKCVSRPDACTENWDPVCGCDGQTYSNECFAAAAGVNVSYPGECVNPVELCYDNSSCKEGTYCYFEKCEAETGMCMEQPDVCPLYWNPVCGCDGKTYSNECDAAAAGVSVDYAGECVNTTTP